MRNGRNPRGLRAQPRPPPVEEGMVFEFEDEKGEISQLEFLGLILHDEQRFGFFFRLMRMTRRGWRF